MRQVSNPPARISGRLCARRSGCAARRLGRRSGFGAALLLCGVAALWASPAAADGWGTTVKRIEAPPAPPPAAPARKIAAPPLRRAQTRFSLREDAAPHGDERFLTARAPLAKGRAHGPYIGAGLAPGKSGGEASGALLGGVAAPFLADTFLFGEMQQLQSSGGEEERRFLLGLRKGF